MREDNLMDEDNKRTLETKYKEEDSCIHMQKGSLYDR